MKRRVFVGLAGPTYFDYANKASKSRNDEYTSPNPVFENIFGLAIFYDEIWFLCESLCPQSIRGHSKVRYFDQDFDRLTNGRLVANDVMRILNILTVADFAPMPDVDSEAMEAVLRSNFEDYWARLKAVGVYWTAQPDAALDNHSHGMSILGASVSANSNNPRHLYIDSLIHRALDERSGGFDFCLNTFTRNQYRLLWPSQFDEKLDVQNNAAIGSRVIVARISNALDKHGPDPSIFDQVCSSAFVKDMRAYLMSKKLGDASAAYADVVAEIDSATKEWIRKGARDARPTRALAQIGIDLAGNLTGIGSAVKVSQLYWRMTKPTPLAASAFLLDLA